MKMITCPYCSVRFTEARYETHVPCPEGTTDVPPPPKVEPAPAKASTVAVTVTVLANDPDLLGFLMYLGLDGENRYSDVFYTHTCGYWLRGMEWDAKRGWLCRETGGELVVEPPTYEADRIKAAWLAGEALPKGWFALDRAAAYRVVEAGIKRNGWPAFADGTADANDYDCAVQIALLGEIVYG